jgi:thiamine kinase-like enzyme
LRVCRDIFGSEERILELLAEPPRTLAHLDFRTDNMFFDRRGRLVLVDFQSISRQRGAADLGRFIGTSVPHSVRRKHLRDLIDAYADVIGSADSIGYRRDDLERDVRLGVLHWLTYALALLPDPILANGRLLRVVETWIDRLTAAVIEMYAMDALA